MSQNSAHALPTPRRPVPLWTQVLIWVGLLGLLAVLLLGLLRTQHPILAVGSTVPNFALKLFDGYGYHNAASVRLSDLRGKVVLVNFWASWCPTCWDEAPYLEAAWRSYQPTGQVVFLGVDYVDTELKARSYLSNFGVSYPNGPDLGTRIAPIFNRNIAMPETYIIDRQGILRQTQIGPFQSEAEIQAILDPLVGGQ